MGPRLPVTAWTLLLLWSFVTGELDCKDLLFEQSLEATNVTRSLTSPNYPHTGQSPLACRVTLVAWNDSWRLAVQVVDMDIGGQNHTQSAVLKLFDGKAFVGSVLASPKENADLRGNYRSSGPQLSIAYEPNLEPHQARGFKLLFHSFDPSTLSVRDQEIPVLTSGGTILSPNYPNSYPDEFTCWWLLRAPYGYNVHIEFEEFQLKDENSDHYWTNLCRDFLLVYEGRSPDLLGSDHSPRKLCGKLEGRSPQTSSGATMYLQFHSQADALQDHANFSKRFRINYKAVPNPRICQPHKTVILRISGDVQILTSPNYPDTFDSDMVCRWHIEQLDRGQKFDFEIRILETTIKGDDCYMDKLIIHWSKLAGAPKQTPICGGQRLSPMLSQGPVDIVFSSDNVTSPQHRFMLTYRGLVQKTDVEGSASNVLSMRLLSTDLSLIIVVCLRILGSDFP